MSPLSSWCSCCDPCNGASLSGGRCCEAQSGRIAVEDGEESIPPTIEVEQSHKDAFAEGGTTACESMERVRRPGIVSDCDFDAPYALANDRTLDCIPVVVAMGEFVAVHDAFLSALGWASCGDGQLEPVVSNGVKADRHLRFR